jgi:hypothetical protein
MSVKGCVSAHQDVSARKMLRNKKEEKHPAYSGMSAEFTFLGQLQAKLAVFVG